MSESAHTKSSKSKLNGHITKKLHGNGDASTLKPNRSSHQVKKNTIRFLTDAEHAAIASNSAREASQARAEEAAEAPKKTRKSKPRAKVATA